MGTLLRELGESYPMDTNKTGFRSFSKNLCILVLRMIVASALEGLKRLLIRLSYLLFHNAASHITLNPFIPRLTLACP